MKVPRTLRISFWSILLINFLLLDGSLAVLRQNPQSWGEVVGGLQMSIHLDPAAGTHPRVPKFRVEMRNAAKNDLVLNLGTMLANGRKQYPNAVRLVLTDARGKTLRLDLREPAGIAGRLDPLVLPISAGAAYSIPVDLDNYWAAASNEFDYKLKPGSYSLDAEFTGKPVGQEEANLDMKGIALMPYWTGMVTSNRVQFRVSSQ